MHSFFGFCQNDTVINNKHGIRLAFGLGTSPVWNYSKDKNDNYNFSAGSLFSINFDNWFEIRTGLLVDFKRYSVYEYYFLHTSSEVKKIEKEFNFHFLRLPICTDIYFLKRTPLLIYSSLGVILGIPYYQNNQNNDFENFKSVDSYPSISVDYSARHNYLLHAGIGLKYYYKKNYFIKIEPYCNYFLINNPQKIENRSSPGSIFYTGNYYGPKYIEAVNSRIIFGTFISISYNLFFKAKNET